MNVEAHPLEPFLPINATVLMLGSFPPPRKRWCMDFYYPNFTNDMWRILSLVFYGVKDRFVLDGEKSFNLPLILDFLNEKGIAIFDSATEVVRLQNNASDKFLQVERETNLTELLRKIPACRALVSTGQKSAEIVSGQFKINVPKVGQWISFEFENREMRFFRMPSSSRAYPLSLEKKTQYYRGVFDYVSKFHNLDVR